MEEALDRRIVVAIARAAHAADDAVAVEEVLVLGARIGTAAIAVMHEAGSRAARAHRGSERFHGDRLYGTGRGGPPDDAPRARVKEDREEEPALARPGLGDISEPQRRGRGA